MLKERLFPTPPIPLPPVRDAETVDLTIQGA
jgi:hypothetical protein